MTTLNTIALAVGYASISLTLLGLIGFAASCWMDRHFTDDEKKDARR